MCCNGKKLTANVPDLCEWIWNVSEILNCGNIYSSWTVTVSMTEYK